MAKDKGGNMKCVCGHKTNEIDDKKSDKFIEIQGNYLIYEHYTNKHVYLYACPKCGTIHMEKWF